MKLFFRLGALALAFLLGSGPALAGSVHIEWLNGNGRGGPPGDVLEAVSLTGFAEDVTTGTGAAVQSGQSPAFAAGEGYARVTARNAAAIVAPSGTASVSNGFLIPQGETRVIPVAAGARLSVLEDPTAAAGATVTCAGCATAANVTETHGTSGSAAPSKGVLVMGSDGTNGRALLTDSGGSPKVVGTTVSGSSTVTTGFAVLGFDGTNNRIFKTGTSGQLYTYAEGPSLSGAADSGGGPVKVGCKYNSTMPTFSDGQRADCQAGARGSLNVQLTTFDGASSLFSGSMSTGSFASDGAATGTNGLYTNSGLRLFNGTSFDRGRSIQGIDGTGLGVAAVGLTAPIVASYAAAGSFVTLATSPTDVFTLTGSASKVVKVSRVELSCTAASAAQVSVALTKRSTADTGGTSSNPTPVPLDSGFAAASATWRYYTANPTTGTAVGSLRSVWLPISTTAASPGQQPTLLYKADGFTAPIVLRGTAEVLAINFGGLSAANGASCNADVEWTEQ